MEKIWQTFLESIDLTHLIVSAAFLIAVVAVWRLFGRMFMNTAKKRGGGKVPAVATTAYDVIRAVFIIVVVLVLLQMNGINVGAMLTGLGIVSAIVGLALQDMLRDILMGIRIVTDKFFVPGDVVVYNGVEGEVVSYNLRSTKLRDLDYGDILTVCNRNITEIRKRSDLLLVNVPLSYDEDFTKIHAVLTDAAAEMAAIDGVKKAQYKGTQSFNDSSITYRIHLQIDLTKKWEIWRKAHTILQEQLAAAKITIPYPQLDVHTK
ncbi:MAG: mechanosensitive ion channel family protein [Oscillospiraceae bacterium]|nr:mechanosensitive ion channel family protein [Oscillospiraceae bacterium]